MCEPESGVDLSLPLKLAAGVLTAGAVVWTVAGFASGLESALLGVLVAVYAAAAAGVALLVRAAVRELRRPRVAARAAKLTMNTIPMSTSAPAQA